MYGPVRMDAPRPPVGDSCAWPCPTELRQSRHAPRCTFRPYCARAFARRRATGTTRRGDVLGAGQAFMTAAAAYAAARARLHRPTPVPAKSRAPETFSESAVSSPRDAGFPGPPDRSWRLMVLLAVF